MSGPVDVSSFSKDNPFPAKITENRLLNKPGSAKETRHFIVDLAGSGLHYKSGDSLGIFPANRPSEVEEILQCLNAIGDEPVLPAVLKLASAITLREVLEVRLALSKPTRRAIEVFESKAIDVAEKSKLTGLL